MRDNADSGSAPVVMRTRSGAIVSAAEISTTLAILHLEESGGPGRPCVGWTIEWPTKETCRPNDNRGGDDLLNPVDV